MTSLCFLVDSSANTQLVFGLNVEDWQGGSEIVIDAGAIDGIVRLT